jgi:hypothetical protein
VTDEPEVPPDGGPQEGPQGEPPVISFSGVVTLPTAAVRSE